jgi:hypothetical protein
MTINNAIGRTKCNVRRTFNPRCTPSNVCCTYSGQQYSMNREKQKNASSSLGIVYRNGAANTFIPCTYVNVNEGPPIPLPPPAPPPKPEAIPNDSARSCRSRSRQTNASRRRTSMSSRTRSLNPRSVASVRKVSFRIFSLNSHGPRLT